tara:strand:- start:103 stop:333 length:231 start_codon:yes stop_codon:yes gene_type:complete
VQLSEYIQCLQDFVEDNPGSEKFEAIASGDDDGNYYNKILWSPELGHFDASEFTTGEDLKSEDKEDCLTLNAVCVN